MTLDYMDGPLTFELHTRWAYDSYNDLDITEP